MGVPQQRVGGFFNGTLHHFCLTNQRVFLSFSSSPLLFRDPHIHIQTCEAYSHLVKMYLLWFEFDSLLMLESLSHHSGRLARVNRARVNHDEIIIIIIQWVMFCDPKSNDVVYTTSKYLLVDEVDRQEDPLGRLRVRLLTTTIHVYQDQQHEER